MRNTRVVARQLYTVRPYRLGKPVRWHRCSSNRNIWLAWKWQFCRPGPASGSGQLRCPGTVGASSRSRCRWNSSQTTQIRWSRWDSQTHWETELLAISNRCSWNRRSCRERRPGHSLRRRSSPKMPTAQGRTARCPRPDSRRSKSGRIRRFFPRSHPIIARSSPRYIPVRRSAVVEVGRRIPGLPTRSRAAYQGLAVCGANRGPCRDRNEQKQSGSRANDLTQARAALRKLLTYPAFIACWLHGASLLEDVVFKKSNPQSDVELSCRCSVKGPNLGVEEHRQFRALNLRGETWEKQ